MSDAFDGPVDHGLAALDTNDGLDLTPRDLVPKTSNRWLPRLALIVIAAALVAVLFQTLGDASLFFYNVDEAIEKRDDLGESRFQLQGTPVNQAVAVSNIAGGEQSMILFSVQFGGAIADVAHVGNPAESFQPGVPVVLEGHWASDADAVIGSEPGEWANDGYYFASSRMLVKHDNDYRVDNQERIAEAERGGMVSEESSN